MPYAPFLALGDCPGAGWTLKDRMVVLHVPFMLPYTRIHVHIQIPDDRQITARND